MDLNAIEKRLKDLVKLGRRSKERQEQFNSLIKRYSEFYGQIDVRYFAKMFGVTKLCTRIGHYQWKIYLRLRAYLKNCPHTDLEGRLIIFKCSPMSPRIGITMARTAARTNNNEDSPSDEAMKHSSYTELMRLQKLGHRATIEFEEYWECWGRERKKEVRMWVKDWDMEKVKPGIPNGNGELPSLRAIFGDTITLNEIKPSNRVEKPTTGLDWSFVTAGT